MDTLVLVKEGIFPIVNDENNNPINEKPQTGFSISGTIQGEGKLAGTSALFIRLASCNLRCIWTMPNQSSCMCDTPYASFEPDTPTNYSIDKIVQIVKHNLHEIKHVVITGGEPFIQKGALALLCKKLKSEFGVHITIETNGTIYNESVAKWVDLFSISPKLSNSDPSKEKTASLNIRYTGSMKKHATTRYNIDALQQFINVSKNYPDKDFQLKFVVAHPEDAIEIKDLYLQKLIGWEKQDVLIMPLGAKPEELQITTKTAITTAIENGWRYCPRIHIEQFGSKQGV